ncbi:MAG: hypothetical protein ABR66_04390 [Microbacteriaceae bacterium BACL25 MAG-120322-bin65]|jgi:peptide/nickel transport system ATP-binding protein|nr:MAG: hypothetical protein ABR66_04390 [Microbacteriaceae bacterium BACL25 MAG-120322-bin65]
MTLLSINDLTVRFPLEDGIVHAVNGVSYSIEPGTTLGCVGESGSGKSVTALSVLGLNGGSKTEISGSISFEGKPIDYADGNALRQLRGGPISIIFQDPLSSLHPFYTVGKQIAEAYLVHHKGASKKEARQQAMVALEEVGIPEASQRIDDYPHQFSGGMRQRIMIAMALINKPRLLIADEPTTALDVTVQAQILDLLKQIQRDTGMAILLITHDFGVVKEMCDDVVVMYGGRVVESAPAAEIFARPHHPYTRGLLDSLVANEDLDAPLKPIPGAPPSPSERFEGCSFAPRCQFANSQGMACGSVQPALAESGPQHHSACFLPVKNRDGFLAKSGAA